MKLRSLNADIYASIVPIILFVLTIVVIGALYTLFFIEIGIPTFTSWIPASDSKTFIMMLIYAMPVIILLVGAISLVREGMKREGFY